MKISLLNILLLVVIAALAIALITLNRAEKSILVGEDFHHVDMWNFPESAATSSQWNNMDRPPPLQVHEIHSIAEEIRQHMDDARKATGFFEWQILGISLENLRLEESNSWVYVIRFEATEYPMHLGVNEMSHLIVMVLMDRTILFDSGNYDGKIVDAVLSFPGIQGFAPTEDKRAAAKESWGMVGGVF